MKLRHEFGRNGLIRQIQNIALIALLALPCALHAQTPTYLTVGPSASGTSSSTTFVPSLGNLTPRIVYLAGDSDKAGSVFSIKKGVGAYVVGTNTAAGTLLNLTTTNGLATSDTLVIQTQSGSITNCTISSFAANGTNVTISITPAFGFTNGDSVYKMSAASTIPIGVNTNKVYTGEAVYVGNAGRPISVVVDGTSWSLIQLISLRQE